MPTNVTMPKLGLTMETGKIVEWKADEGSEVKQGDILLVVETEKITYDVEAPATGILHIIVPVEGEVPVADLIGVIAADKAEYDNVAKEGAPAAAPAAAAAPQTDASKVVPISSAQSSTPAVDASNINLVVIGGGPGGYPAAIRAAQLGAKVTIIEKDKFGGTCLNRGCIPTKSLLQSAGMYHSAKNAGVFGVKTSGVTLDFPAVMNRKNTVVKQLVGGLGGILKSHGMKIINGTGTLIDATTVKIIETGEEVKADKIIIATGSVPSKVPIEGVDQDGVITSDEALNLKKLPKSILIIGGGVIGMEFAQVLSRMDVEVTVVEMLPQILPYEDAEIVAGFTGLVKKEGVEIHTNTSVSKIAAKGKKKLVTFGDKQKEVELVLVAVGRSPYTEGLGLDKVGIKMDKNFINVNEFLETSVKGIYAIGDVIGNFMLAHVATAEGECAAQNALGQPHRMDRRSTPRAVYTTPEVASVGLSEADAKKQYGDLQIGRFPFVGCGKALVINETSGMVKIIADKKYGEVLGVAILGPHATDLINEAALAIQMEATFEEIAHTIHAHPTIAESIMEAALDVDAKAIHMPKKRK
ncbi:MAG: dihydrolipoyl dehydrogenase [Deltaproteobacteria bacterium]|nr:dihydrolipoyl dehydrogenase [Deltaproteobacteria bacterium]